LRNAKPQVAFAQRMCCVQASNPRLCSLYDLAKYNFFFSSSSKKNEMEMEKSDRK
jgi:hypothetical protein